MGVGALALAAWVFLRAQGVETWETIRTQRWGIAATLAALVIFPVMFADTNYDRAAPKPNNAPAIRGLFSRAGTSLALVPRGAPAPTRCCNTILNHDEWPPLGTDERTDRDLLVLLPVDATRQITALRLVVTGENGLEASVADGALRAAGDHLETRAYPNESGPAAADGHHIATGWMARVPVTLNPTHPWDIGGDRYPLTVTATYRVAGDDTVRTYSARAAVDAQVGRGIYEMGLASSILPLLCFGAAFFRWRRTR